MKTFDIHPFEGPLPVFFGMSRATVIELLGVPTSPEKTMDYWGENLEICIGYNESSSVIHAGFRPGSFELRIQGILLWTPDSHPDPNVVLLQLDSEPLEYVGFLMFSKLGVSTTGFHDDDPSQYAISMVPRGEGDRFLKKAKRPDLSWYDRA